MRTLQSGHSTTPNLERVTGENRYNLYHHLSVLEQAGLVGSRIRDRVKQFFLRKPKRPDATFLEFDREHSEERGKFEQLRSSIVDVLGDEVPHLDEVTKIRLMLTYPWSDESPR